MRHDPPEPPIATWTRRLGAAALLAVGIDHLAEFTAGQYSSVPTIGTLFVLNFASAAIVAAGLLFPWTRVGSRAGRIAPPLLAAAGIGIAGGALVGLLVSESSGLFGFREAGYGGAIVLAIALEVAAVVLLGVYLIAVGRLRRRVRAAGRRPAILTGHGRHTAP